VGAAGLEPINDDNEFVEANVLESLPLGAMHFEYYTTSNIQKSPPWFSYGEKPKIAHEKLSDCYAMQIGWILSTWDLYPGDNEWIKLRQASRRFSVDRVGKDAYLIKDNWTKFKATVPIANLQNPYFDIRGWYAKKRARALNLEKPKVPYHSFGLPLSEIPEMLLMDGVHSHYPSASYDMDTNECRFAVERVSLDSHEDYQITDRVFDIVVPVSGSMLMDPSLDLVGWYRDFIQESGVYPRFYEKDMLAFEEGLLEYRECLINGEEVPPPLSAPINDIDSEDDNDSEISDECSDWGLVEDISLPSDWDGGVPTMVEECYVRVVEDILDFCAPFPKDRPEWFCKPRTVDVGYRSTRFEVTPGGRGLLEVYDRRNGSSNSIHLSCLKIENFSVDHWYAEICAKCRGYYHEAAVRCAVVWYHEAKGKLLNVGTCLEDEVTSL
jgi:hypothetical protein